jgi:futalosine hydrolase
VSLLAVVATRQERDALLRDRPVEPVRVGPHPALRCGDATVLVCGIGPAAAAAATATALALSSYRAVLSLGICGGFRGAAEVGDVVVATDLVVADLGADSPEGFLAMGQLGWAEDEQGVDPALVSAVAAVLGEVVIGPVLTVSTVTGTSSRAQQLAERHGAVAEAMEGWGAVEAARPHGVPVLEVRTVSNEVGERNTDAWDIPRAFAALSGVGALLEATWL